MNVMISTSFIFLIVLIQCTLGVDVSSKEYLNQTLNAGSSSTVNGYGYKSNYGSLSEISGRIVQGYGAFSMSKANLVNNQGSSQSYCTGDSSCAYVNDYIGYNLQCDGINTCSHMSNISVTTNVDCKGDHSCSYSNFYGVLSIYARGAYSLINSNIYSSGSTISVNFSANYAGYNATVFCESGDNCIINCNGNGCTNTLYNCDSCSSMTIYCNETIQNCPKTTSSSGNSDNYDIFDTYSVGSYSFSEDLNDISNILDIMCETDSNAITFDDHYSVVNSLNGSAIDADIICCRGRRSCYSLSSLVSNEYIICSGSQACPSADYIATQIAYCGTWEACYNVDGSASSGGTYMNVSDIIYCLGFHSCGGRRIYGTQLVYASGYITFWGTKLYGIGKVIISAAQYDVEIYSNGANTQLILCGWYAGNQVSFSCDTGDVCVVNCKTVDSCPSSMTIDCSGECFIECDDDQDTCPQESSLSGNYVYGTPTTTVVSVTAISQSTRTDHETTMDESTTNSPDGPATGSSEASRCQLRWVFVILSCLLIICGQCLTTM